MIRTKIKGHRSMKKIISVLLAAVMGITLCTSCGKDKKEAEKQPEKPSAKVTVDGTKFMVNGKELWINGVNTPWQNWNDFNGNMDVQFWDDTFKQLAQDNINCTRIWVNCNGTTTVRLKSTGGIKNINENHWTDLDKLFDIAEKYEVYIMPTLLSFDHCKDERWQLLVESKENCDQFAEMYAAEFAKRYGDEEYLFGIDIMNEPDWVHENDECGKLEWDNISYLFAKCAQAIHENSSALVTVGMGIVKYNSDNYEGNFISDEYLKSLSGSDKSYVDFYSPHWYSWQIDWYGYPFTVTPEAFGMDGTKPCVIGETSNDYLAKLTSGEIYEKAYENGWNGVMFWMEYRNDGTSGCDSVWYRYDLTQQATKAMFEKIPEKIYPLK